MRHVISVALAVALLGSAGSAAAADSVGQVDTSTGMWHLRDPASGNVTSFFFGNPGDVPVIGDWDCDGDATPGLFRTSDAFAYLRNSNSQGIADIRFFFGNPSDVPLAGDWDGDGCDTLSIYRPSEQRFFIINQLGKNEGGLGAADFDFVFGNPGDKPVVGDWDGDGTDEVGLHRESTGFFYWRNTLDSGNADDTMFFGDPGDQFVAGDWGTLDGVDTPAVFRPSNTTFFFRHTLSQGVADDQLVVGDTNWLPVAGEFGTLALPGSIETIARFLSNFETAWQTGNGFFLFERIHPVSIAILGRPACEELNTTFIGDPTWREVLLSVSGPTLWTNDGYPGAPVIVPNTYTVVTDGTVGGITERRTWHLGIVGEKLHWFPRTCDLLE